MPSENGLLQFRVLGFGLLQRDGHLRRNLAACLLGYAYTDDMNGMENPGVSIWRRRIGAISTVLGFLALCRNLNNCSINGGFRGGDFSVRSAG
jgi:hypothetical protein